MGPIVLIDTSVFLNILDVPGRNQKRHEVAKQLKSHLYTRASLALPIAVIIETGNHIARLTDGNHRRRFGGIFVDQVRKSISGEAPFRPTDLPKPEDLMAWIGGFPDHCLRSVSFADFTIIHDFQMLCDRHPLSRVLIWSVDDDLSGYDRTP